MTLNERYQVHERIGEGGMALVYRATDLRLNRQVAVKMLRPQYAGDPEFVARFEQEARAAAALSHPHIAAVYDTGEDRDNRYIVMELLRPFTLKDLIGRSPQGRLTPGDAVKYASQIAAALAHAHQRGVVHRDIKPQNILFTDDGLVKVTDFGIARALAATSGTATGTILGSPHYLAPEQASGGSAGPASDLYSLGVVVYELLTGRPPFSGETPVAIALQHLRATAPPPGQVVPGVPLALDRVVQRCMAKRPEDRYGSADEVRLALEDAVSGGAAGGRTMVLPAAARRPDGWTVDLPPVASDEPEEEEPYRRPPPPPGLNPAKVAWLVLLVVAAVIIGTIASLRGGGHEPPATPEQPAVEVTGARQVQAPDLRGQDVDAARQWIEQTFAAQQMVPPQVVEADRKDNSAAANEILEQIPAPGSQMEEGGVIRVVVSTGRTPTTVPDLVGINVDRARSSLQDSGLMLGTVKNAHSETYVADVVMRQSLAAGQSVAEGTAVDVVVSLGPQPVEPPPATTEPPPAKGDDGGTHTVPEVSLSIGQPTDVGNGQKEATIVIAVPEGSPARRVELRWRQGGEGVAAAAAVPGGGFFQETVKGPAGAVLGVFVDGHQKDQVRY